MNHVRRHRRRAGLRLILRAGLLCWMLLGGQMVSLAAAQEGEAASAEEGQFQQVAERYRKILERRPRRDTAFDLWYRHYLDAGRLEQLAEQVRKQAADKPDDYGAQVLAGLVEERRGDDAKALAAYQKAESLDADNYYPPLLQATLHIRQQRPDEAIAALSKSLQLKPPRPELLEIYKRLGRLQLQRQQTSEALATLAAMAEAFPDDGQVLEELAQLLADEGEHDEAIKRYEQLVAIAADDPYQQLQARIEIAQLKLGQGQRDEAIQLLEQALQQAKPDSWIERDIRRRIEQAFVQGNDLSGLVAWCRQRHQRHPQDLATLVQLADALKQLGKANEALVHYQRLVELAPSRRDLRELLIDALAASDKLPGAIQQCELLVEQQPDDSAALRRLGELHLAAAGESDRLAEQKAIDVWKRIAETGAADARLAVEVAELCRQAAQRAKHRAPRTEKAEKKDPPATISPLLATAEEHYRLAIRRAPAEPQYREYLGEFLHAQDRRQEAVAVWKGVASTPQETADGWRRLAEIYAGFDYLDEALAAAARAVELEPASFAHRDYRLGLLLKKQDHDAALHEARELTRLAEGEAALDRALKRSVEAHAAAGRVEQEIARLTKIVAAKDATLHDRWLLGLLLADQWKFADAARAFAAALAEAGDHVTLLVTYADALKRSGDATAAIAQFQRLAKTDPRARFRCYQEIIQLELQRNNPTAARQAADDLVKLAPGSLEVYRIRAAVDFRLKDALSGLRNLRQAVRIAPRDVEVRLQIARELAEVGQRDEALEHYWRAFELSEALPDKVSLSGIMAELAQRRGKFDEFLGQLRRLRLRQDDPKAFTLCLNEALLCSKRYGEAQQELLALLDKQGDDADLLRQLASIAERQSSWQAAVEYQQRLVALDDSPAHLKTLARYLSEQGEAAASARIWQRLLAEAKDDTAAAAVVDHQFQEARLAEAAELATMQLEKDPQSWRMLLRLGLAHWLRNEPDEARKAYEALLALKVEPAVSSPPAAAPLAPTSSPSTAVAAAASAAATPASAFVPAAPVPAAYATTTAQHPLIQPPPFGFGLVEMQEIQAAREILALLVLAQSADVNTRFRAAAAAVAAAQPQPPTPRNANAAQANARTAPQRTAARTAARARFVPSFADDIHGAQLEATAALHVLARQQQRLEQWYASELALGKSDSARLRRALLTHLAHGSGHDESEEKLVAQLFEARPEDPLPHLARLHPGGMTIVASAAPLRGVASPIPMTDGAEKERLVSTLQESHAWLVRRHPQFERDISYYYVLRLNSLGAAEEANELLARRMAEAKDFDDLGALANLILASGNESAIRAYLARAADLAKAPKLAASQAVYANILLRHAIDSGKYTGEADLPHLLRLLDRYLASDDALARAIAASSLQWTYHVANGQVVTVQRNVSGAPTLIPSFDQSRPEALLAQLRAYERQLSEVRSGGATTQQIELVKRRYEMLARQLAALGVSPNQFPEANNYLDDQKFALLERLADSLRKTDQVGKLLERLNESAEVRDGQDRVRCRLAAAFTQWWAGDQAAAVAALEKLRDDHPYDQVLAVTLAQAYFASGDFRQALAIVERIKNPEPAVAQPVERLRQVLRDRYSDLARLRDLRGHTHVVRSLAFSPDGQQLLSGSYDRTLRIWDVESGNLLKSISGHADLVLAAAWSPRGDRLASGSYDEIRLWDAVSGAELKSIKSPGGAVRSLRFSPDGKLLATAGDDHVVRLWHVADGSLAASLEGHTERVFCVVFSPDGGRLATAGGDKTVRLWDVATRKQTDVLTGHSASISCVAFSHDGQTLASGSDDRNVMLWRVASGKAFATLQRHTDSVFSVAFSPDGNQLASGGADRSVKLWNLAALDTEPVTLLGHSNTVASLDYAADGKTLASAGYDELIKLWTLLSPRSSEPAALENR